MNLTYWEAAKLLFDLTPEEQAYARDRREEILRNNGHLDEAIRTPIEEIAAQREKDGRA